MMKSFYRISIALIYSSTVLWACSGKESQPAYRKTAARNYYIQNCASCHGDNGQGTMMGVDLTKSPMDKETMKQIIIQGSARMPRFQVSEPLLSDLADWIKKLQ